jgi:phage terminase small subunit
LSKTPRFTLPSTPARRHWKAPAHLAPATRRWFGAVVRDYVVEEHHVRLLTTAAEAWDRGEQARTILDAKGLTYTDRFGQPRVRPEFGVERDSRIAFMRALRELALDISAPGESRPVGITGRRNNGRR